MSVITKKICLLGDFSVGKTSLIRRFIEDKFSDNYLSTVGVKVSRKSVDYQGSQGLHQVNLLIWDLEGNTKFKSITPSYLKGSSGSIIVADLTRNNTINSIGKHIEVFLKVNPAATIIVALNKADLINPEKLDKLIEIYNSKRFSKVIKTYTTSAKTGEYVNNMFDKLTKSILENQ